MLSSLNPLAPITVGSGLLITINPGICLINGTPVSVSSTVVSLTQSAVNYVQVNTSGSVIVNTSGFTSGNFPVATITCSGTGIQTVVDSRSDFNLPSPLPAGTTTRSVTINIDGSGVTPATGVHARWSVPVACTVTGWVLVADQSGSAVIDVKRSTYAGFPTTASIAGTDKPTLSAVQKNENLGPLSNWTSTALVAGDVIEFNLSSAATVIVLTLTLNLTVP